MSEPDEVKPRRQRKTAAPVEDSAPVEDVVKPPKMTPTQKQTGSNPPPGLRRPIESGDRGPLVVDVQKKLTTLGFYDGRITGVYGYMTVKAVRRLQGAHSLRPSGVIDAATWAALNLK